MFLLFLSCKIHALEQSSRWLSEESRTSADAGATFSFDSQVRAGQWPLFLFLGKWKNDAFAPIWIRDIHMFSN
jgi:hypothetical protein